MSSPSKRKVDDQSVDYVDEDILEDDDEDLEDEENELPKGQKQNSLDLGIEAKKIKSMQSPLKKIFVIQVAEDKLISNDVVIVTLPHLKSKGKEAKYIYIEKEHKILQIQRAIEEPSSWFIDNSVQQDGSLYLASIIDPLFLITKLLQENRKKTESHEGYFCDIDQMLQSTTNQDFVKISSLFQHVDLSLISDVQAEGSDKLFRLNDEKYLQWLHYKAKYLAEYLKRSVLLEYAQNSAQAATFRASKKEEKKYSESDILEMAVGFLSEFIDDDSTSALRKILGLSFAPQLLFVNTSDNLTEKERRKSFSQQSTSKTTPSKKPKTTPVQNKLAKINTKGISKIDSFFKKA